MKKRLRPFLPSSRSVLWSALCVLVAGLAPFRVLAVDPPSEKELSTMGQGFGKFVGSFMRQVQSDEEKKGAPVEERRPVERPAPSHRESVARSERSEAPAPRRETEERRPVPYRLYDPWGADHWGDPVFGFNPWERSPGWVDYDWNLRKQQYGWSYGGVPDRHYARPWDRGHPYPEGRFGGGGYPPYYERGHPYEESRERPVRRPWSDSYTEERAPSGWGQEADRRHSSSGGPEYRSRDTSPWSRPPSDGQRERAGRTW
ncbi:MAG: hypothetical protein H7837_03410 [Magnetococcus sp. MYC-9]